MAPTHRIYHGNSMRTVFRFGDRLAIHPVGVETVQVGDIIAYRSPTDPERKTIVHRVVARTKTGVRTKGDANAFVDPYRIAEEHFLGKVVSFRRDDKVHWIKPESSPRKVSVICSHLYKKCCTPFFHLVRQVLRYGYRLLRNSGLVLHLWHPRVTRIVVNTTDGKVIKFMHGKRTVARYGPSPSTWVCKKPYDLILSPDDLP